MNTQPLEIGQKLQGIISDVAFGGNGVLKSEYGVIFVPFCLTGEEVEVEITKISKRYAHAKLTGIIKPSPYRVNTLCPHFTSCGGCQLQHAQYEHQLKIKKQFLQDCLTRIAKIDHLPQIELHPSIKKFSYRKHIEWTLIEDKQTQKTYGAYHRANQNKSVFKVESCPIFIEDNAFITCLQNQLETLNLTQNSKARLRLIKHGLNEFTLCFHFQKLPRDFLKWAKKLQSEVKQYQLSIEFSSPTRKGNFGKTEANYSFNNYQFSFSPLGFVQNNFETSELLYSEIREVIRKLPKAKGLDLFSGVGISSLFLSSISKSITSIEMNAHCVSQAKENLALNKIDNVSPLEGDIYKIIHDLNIADYDWALLNPPREGVKGELLQAISSLKTLIYVSCNPSTLARDLERLNAITNYEISLIKIFDLFPQTTHLETLIVLTNTGLPLK